MKLRSTSLYYNTLMTSSKSVRHVAPQLIGKSPGHKPVNGVG